MKVVDRELLVAIIQSCRCDLCEPTRYHAGGVDPAHVIARGMGGASRMDIAENVAALCRRHHNLHHDGHLTQADLWAAIGRRLGKSAEECERVCREVLRTKKPAHA